MIFLSISAEGWAWRGLTPEGMQVKFVFRSMVLFRVKCFLGRVEQRVTFGTIKPLKTLNPNNFRSV